MWKLTLILLLLLCYISHGLDHSKTFLLQDSVDTVRSVGVYKESFLYSCSTDIVQKNIETGRIERTFRAHPNSVQSLLVLNNSVMISGCYGNFVILWDLETGSVLKRFYLGSAEILLSGLIVLNDVVFTSGLDGNVRRIDLTSNRVTVLARFPNQVTCITAYGDFMFACVRTTPLLRKFLISSGASLGSFSGHLSPCLTLAIVGNNLFSASGDGTFIKWDANTGLYLKDFGGLDVAVDKLYSYRGFLYSSDRNDIVTKWDIESGKVVMKYIDQRAFFILCFDFKDDVMFFGNSNGFVAAFNDSSGEQLAIYSGTAKRLNALVFWKNYIVSAGSGSFLTMWDSASNGFEPLRRINVDGDHVYCMAVYEDFAYFGGASTIAYKWDLIDFRPTLLYNGHLQSIASILVTNDYLITGGSDAFIFQFNVSSAEIIHVYLGHTLTVNAVRLVDNLLLSASDDKYIITWDLNTRDDVRNFRLTGNINDILIVGDNLYVAAAYGMDLYSVSTYELLASFRESFECLTLSTDNSRLFGGYKDSRIRVRDMNSLNILEVYQGHSDVVTSLCFSDGFTLFSAGYDGTIKKWNMISRKVAFSFENRNGSITSIGALAGQIFVGYRNGLIASFDIESSNSGDLINVHTRTISSIITFEDGYISSGLDGLIVWHNQTDSSNSWTLLNQQPDSIRHLTSSASLLAFITRDAEINFLSRNDSVKLPGKIVSETPVQCLAIADSLLLAGSKSGGVYAWSLEDGQLEFELKEHTGGVNDIVVNEEAIISASDDGSIIQWSLKTLILVFIMKRQSVTSLGHSGPVLSLSTCRRVLFSGGSDMSTRRWNLDNGKHQDVYFGPTKAVSTVLCYNNSVYSGSEDSAVYMYTPENLISAETKTSSAASSLRNGPRKVRQITKSANEIRSLQLYSFLVPTVVVVACVSLILSFGFIVQLYRRKQQEPPRQSQDTSYTSNTTTSDMATFVNSSMGISKHAAFELPSSAVVVVKNLATGGGGSVNIAKLTDPALAKQHGSTVIQKKVFVRDEISKESFDQEVGIMVMLSSYPHFCKIIGYTLNPIALILEYYPDGSLADWIKSQTALSPYVTKLSREIAQALLTMHSRYLAHCDIKTLNILIRVTEGVPSCCLTDFGITQVLSDIIVDAKFFSIVNLRGLTVNFAAPEAFMNFRKKINTAIDYKRYDIYSFACVLYELMSRRTPWK